MSVELLAEMAWKSVLLAGLTLVLLGLARNRSAAERSLIGDAGLLSLLILPMTIAWLPRVELAPPGAFSAAIADIAGEAAQPDTISGVTDRAHVAATFDWNAFTLGAYLVPVAALLAGLLFGLIRLRRLYAGARVLEDASWLLALAAEQNRSGIKHATALLMSNDVKSPVSWGVVRPVIVVDPSAYASTVRADAIIAHELAHVQRLDWLRLILARVAVALFWFNPLAWVLARRCYQLREEAADDAVLRTRPIHAQYADLLLTAVRYANTRPLLAANGVAPSRSSIAQRVTHVLDASAQRRPAALGWIAASIAIALGANAAVAATQLVVERGWGIRSDAGERAAEQLAVLPGVHPRTLAAAIRTGDWSARRVSGPTTYTEPRAVKPLLLAMRDDNPMVRRIAVWGLSEMRPLPDNLVIPQVSSLLEDPSPAVRAEAAGAIGEFPSVANSGSIEKLLLTDPSTLVRLRAAHALGDIQDPGSRQALEQALRDRDPDVRAKARWALRQVGDAERIMNR